ncbi:hypothetical protein G195_011102 [Phytophthora kernoviae 00238/432]|uniref:Uncharacterized protein n=2 Tax=Phytophthora kernoviae TaxID=325452 RepID=A0A8T0M1S4_9STRA|nr:hypothetical protein G195_011102 [Phytophthora kernoviae 00238/432]KAG2527049.1 hypothetical protein JM16_002919 [Phytophthora kernoviae]
MVSTLRNEFLQKEKGLSIAEFVYVMMRFVQSSAQTDENSRLHDLSESQLVANLCELFAQIDINGDGSMEWEEFTSFIVDTGLTVKNHQPNSIQEYHYVQWEDASKHSTFIDHIYYFPSNDLVALVESCSPFLKIYNVNCELIRTIKSPEGFVQIWDIRNFACMQTFTAENMGDVKNIVSITSEKRILIKFDYEKLENPELTDDHPVFIALYNPTSLSFITAAGRDVKIWDARLGKLIRVYRDLSTTDLTTLCLDFRERKFIIGDHGGNIQVFDYLNGSHMKSFAYPEQGNRAHTAEVTKLCYCAEHMAVISVSWDCSISIHDESDSERGVLLRRLVGGHTTDITALSFSYHLSLLASGSSDCSLQVWDYEFGRLDATCIGHVTGLLSLHFLDPFPLLLSGDSTGNLCFWAMRPAAKYKGKCVFRFRNQHDHLGTASVNCITTHSTHRSSSSSSSASDHSSDGDEREHDPLDFTSFLVITGDDKGFLSVWNVLPLLMRLATSFELRPLSKPVECANAQRNLRVDAASMVRKARNTPEWAAYASRDSLTSFFFSAGMPLVDVDADAAADGETRYENGELRRFPPVSLVHRWKAHGDVIYSVQMIAEPKSLVTSSFDRRVKIWSLSGECLGVLMQGGLNPSSSNLDTSLHRPWRFSVDYDARERHKETAAAPVVEDVHTMLRRGEKRDLVAERRRTERIAQEAAAEASVLEEISRTYLPPLLPRRAANSDAINSSSSALGAVVYHQGEPQTEMLLLKDGRVESTKIINGQEHTLDVMTHGAISSNHALTKDPAAVSVRCLTPVTGFSLQSSALDEVLEDKTASREIMHSLSKEIRRQASLLQTPLLEQHAKPTPYFATSVAASIESFYRSGMNSLLNARLTGQPVARLFPEMHLQIPTRVVYINGFKGIRHLMENHVDADQYEYPQVVRLVEAVSPGVIMTPVSSMLEAFNAGHMNPESLATRWIRGTAPRMLREVIFGVGLNQLSDYFEERLSVTESAALNNALGSMAAGILSGYLSHIPHNLSTMKLMHPQKTYGQHMDDFIRRAEVRVPKTVAPRQRYMVATALALLFPRGLTVRTSQIVGSFIILNGTINSLKEVDLETIKGFVSR